ncbi:MAG: multidrug effflux MFS transporter [Bacteroidota bacterium]|nr:multidrug effflux MFS transporter [Bacteroidota bacterium]MDP4251314.1 multidrug effflux MFS transporter [Bacteroidota bacterium]
MTKSRYISLILILGSLTALTPFSIDMYLPGFPAIARDLATSASRVSLSLSGFFIGISAGQLIYGPLLDRFGRKKPLYTGLAVYILASVGCAFSHSIESLISIRFIQALGSCAATVTSVAMVRDLFPVNENAKVFALLMLVLGASPMIAPTIGGYITAAFGWHAVFIVLTLLCILVFLACIFWLPDGMKPDHSLSLKPVPIIHGFLAVLKDPSFYTYCFTGGIAFTGLFAYVSGSPVVFMKVYGVGQRTYGWIFAFLSIGFIGSSQLNNILLKKFSSQQIIQTILACYALLSVLFLIASQMGWLTLPVIIVFLFLLLSCVGIVNPNTASLTLAPFARNAGTASALMGAIQMGMGALISVFISLFEKPSTTPLATAMTASAILSLTVLRMGSRNIRPAENPTAG